MIKRLHIQEAIDQALKSEMYMNHGAVLIYRGKIVGKGCNKYINSNNKWSMHAEETAIKSALNKLTTDKLKCCTMVIVRVNNSGECVNSYPCLKCRKLIDDYSIKKVIYS